MDEKKGRAIARRAGLRLIGVLGLMVLAKRLGLLTSVAAVIEELRGTASFRIASDLEARVLRDAGE